MDADEQVGDQVRQSAEQGVFLLPLPGWSCFLCAPPGQGLLQQGVMEVDAPKGQGVTGENVCVPMLQGCFQRALERAG